MARSEARLSVTIWDDPDFLALSISAQRMFMFLLSQRDLAHDGVIALRDRRWARTAGNGSVAQVAADLDELHAARFIVMDDDAMELLIRSFIRRDKVYRQPNVLRAAADHLPTVSSPLILAALAVELRRIAAADDIKPDAAGVVAEMLEAIGNPSPNPSPKGSGKPPEAPGEATPEPLPDGPPPRAESGAAHTASESGHSGIAAGGNPSGKGSGNPSAGTPGERGDVTYIALDPPDPEPLAPYPSPPTLRVVDEPGADLVPLIGELLPADAPEPESAGQLTRAWIDYCTRNQVKLTNQHIKRYGSGVKKALGEGFTVDIVKRALAEMLADRVASRPGLLNNYLIRVQQGPELPPQRATRGEASVIRTAPPGSNVGAIIHDALTRPA